MRQPFFYFPGAALVAALGLASPGLTFGAESGMSVHHRAVSVMPPAFVASRDKPYGALADDAMAVMNDGMARAPMTGDADHDFASMMVPHHQGAVDMAKAELLYGTNPVLRRLAQEIIITQGQEIQVMQLELKKIPASAKP